MINFFFFVVAVHVAQRFYLFHNVVVDSGALGRGHEFAARLKVQQVLGALNRAKAMSDYNDGEVWTFSCKILNSSLYFNFWLRVKGGSGFVENQNFRFFNQGARNSDALLLATWHIDYSSSANISIHAFLKFKHESRVCLVQRLLTILFSGISVSKK
jgi:hypothetical protein